MLSFKVVNGGCVIEIESEVVEWVEKNAGKGNGIAELEDMTKEEFREFEGKRWVSDLVDKMVVGFGMCRDFGYMNDVVKAFSNEMDKGEREKVVEELERWIVEFKK